MIPLLDGMVRSPGGRKPARKEPLTVQHILYIRPCLRAAHCFRGYCIVNLAGSPVIPAFFSNSAARRIPPDDFPAAVCVRTGAACVDFPAAVCVRTGAACVDFPAAVCVRMGAACVKKEECQTGEMPKKANAGKTGMSKQREGLQNRKTNGKTACKIYDM